MIISLEVAPDMVVDMLVAVLYYEEQAIRRALVQFADALDKPTLVTQFNQLWEDASAGR